MPFTSVRTDDIQEVGAGERVGDSHIILTATTFEDNLLIGRFAKLDAGSIDNIDASATPVIAGVVLRNTARPVEDDNQVDSDLYTNVEYARWGLVTVKAVEGENPTRFDAVFVHNLADADAGKATLVDSADTEAVNAEFIEEVDTDVWLIQLNGNL